MSSRVYGKQFLILLKHICGEMSVCLSLQVWVKEVSEHLDFQRKLKDFIYCHTIFSIQVRFDVGRISVIVEP